MELLKQIKDKYQGKPVITVLLWPDNDNIVINGYYTKDGKNFVRIRDIIDTSRRPLVPYLEGLRTRYRVDACNYKVLLK